MPISSLVLAFAACIAICLHAEPQSIQEFPPPPDDGYEWTAVDGEGLIWMSGKYVASFDGVRYQSHSIPGGESHVSDSSDGWVYITTSDGVWRARGSEIVSIYKGSALYTVGIPNGAVIFSSTSVALWRSGRGIVAHQTRPSFFGATWDPITKSIAFGSGTAVYLLSESDLNRDEIRPQMLPGSQSSGGLEWMGVARDNSGVYWLRSQVSLARLAPGDREPAIVGQSGTVFWHVFTSRDGTIYLPQVRRDGKRYLAIARDGNLQYLPSEAMGVAAGKDGTLWLLGLEALQNRSVGSNERIRSWDRSTNMDSDLAFPPVRMEDGLHFVQNTRSLQVDDASGAVKEEQKFGRSVAITNATAHKGWVVLTELGGFLTVWNPAMKIYRKIEGPSERSGPRTSAIAVHDNMQNLWVAWGDGIMQLDDAFRPKTILQVPGAIRPVDFLFDPAGRAWVALRDSLGLFVDGKWKKFTTADGLGYDGIRTLTWQDGSLWLGYAVNNDEILRITPTADGSWNVLRLGPSAGFPLAGGTRFIRTDSRGWLWRGTVNNGVHICETKCTDPAQWVIFRQSEGLPSNETAQNAWREDSVTGNVWATLRGGLSEFRVDRTIFARSDDPLVHVARPAVAGDKWILKWGSTFFQHRSALQIRYRLWGTDSQWINAGQNQWEAAYSGLSWGNHTFEVQGRVGRHSWHPDVARTNISIPYPYPVQTAAAVFALVLGAGYGTVRRRRSLEVRRRYAQLRRATAEAREIESEPERDLYLAALNPALAFQVRAILSGREDESALPIVIPAVPPDDLSGYTLAGRYLAEKCIAKGGFATVYRARDLKLNGRPTAIKIIDQSDDTDLQRWIDREIEVSAGFQHPGVVAVFDRGASPWGSPFLTLEFIDGCTLREALADGSLDRGRAVQAMAELAEILTALHRAQIVHRDLKPENLMLSRRPRTGGGSLVVIDLGIASLRQRRGNSAWATHAAGSFDYMAPEQICGSSSPAADIYSFSLIICEVLTGVCVTRYAAQSDISVLTAAQRLLNVAGLEEISSRIAPGLHYEPSMRPRIADDFWQAIAVPLSAEIRTPRT